MLKTLLNMARIKAFQPYRYSPEAGKLDQLVTQPYDKISPKMQADYIAKSPYNLVRVILGEKFPSDSDSDNVYTRAAEYLRNGSVTAFSVRRRTFRLCLLSGVRTSGYARVPGSHRFYCARCDRGL